MLYADSALRIKNLQEIAEIYEKNALWRQLNKS